jgi:hypothetical protein
VGHLRLAGAELTVHFGDGLGLQTAAEQVVALRDTPGELADLFASLEDGDARLEATDVGGLPGGADDVRGGGLADVGRVGEFCGAGDGDALVAVEAGLYEFVCGCGTDTGETFEFIVCHRNLP